MVTDAAVGGQRGQGGRQPGRAHGHGGARFEQRQRLAFGNGAAAHDQRGAVVQIGEQGKSFME